MRWQIARLEEAIRARKTQRKCKRCGFLYQKTLEECPHCRGINDLEVQQALSSRAPERKNIGKGMVIAIVIILVLLVLVSI